jgi:hypothetical protein
VKLAAFVLMVFGLSSVSMARPSSGPGIPNYDPSAIYGALKVKEKYLNPGIAGSSRTQKAVGGLACTKSVLIVRRAKVEYDCVIAE